MPSSSAQVLPPTRRIVTTHSNLAHFGNLDDHPTASPSCSSSDSALEPAVSILIDDDYGQLHNGQIWWGSTSADEKIDVDRALTPPDHLVVRNGSNCRTTTLEPGQVTPMHRTSSLDYNIVTHGTLTLLTPLTPSVPSDWPPSKLTRGATNPALRETTVHVGEVVVQRGTIHAWRNDTTFPARWTCVLTDAVPVRPNLAECWVVEDEHQPGRAIVKDKKEVKA